MPTFAIIGAGAGLGLHAARTFGARGHSVALVARSQEALDDLVATLSSEGVTAEGFAADIRDPAALRSALDAATASLGDIDVLQFSPVPAGEFMKPTLQTGPDDLVGPLEMSVIGAATAITHVLPGMRSRGRGTVLFVNGSSAVRPNGAVTGTSVAFAAETAYAQLLHDALAPEGVHVGQLIIPRGIGNGEPSHAPDHLAELLWSMHSERPEFQQYAAPLDA